MLSNKRAVLICQGTACVSSGSPKIKEAVQEEVRKLGLDDVEVKITGCHGFCQRGPVVVIEPEGIFYSEVQIDDTPEIVRSHLQHNKPVRRLFYKDPLTSEPIPHYRDITFYKKQQRIITLRNCGHINPEDIEDYLTVDGYQALRKVLLEMTPEQVIQEIKSSGLRGRGGAGFPTGKKWEFCRNAPGSRKYMICNADEGDPGAFMDRSMLEADPHSVLEGLIIAGCVIGAIEGYIYVRAEYPLAVKRIRTAIKQAEDKGFLGQNILGTKFSFRVNVMEGAGAFVCGEETGLIASIEGRSGRPRPRPPYPAQSGLWGEPTTINNVKTLASVPVIISRGADWYASIGTENSKGTAVFALTGHIANCGLVEVAMGTTLRQIIFDIGGGIPHGRKFKAAQMGGPSGGCVPAKFLDLPIDYDSVKQVGAIMGSGGLIVMDETTCMVDIARFFTDFVQKESCGKCVPCRIGTKRMHEILERICCGEGKMEDLDSLERLGKMVAKASLCGLGQTAPNPVLSTLRYFRQEYEAHIHEKRCPAGACVALVTSPCQNACPAGVNVPEYVSLVAEKRFTEALQLIRGNNPFPSVCGRVCDHPCEVFCRRGEIDDPIAVRELKRLAADKGKDSPIHPYPGERQGRVAIVGSGPAGLTAAYFLARMGREVVVFEQNKVAGGAMVTAIPGYRLPRDVLQKDIDYICSHGVELRLGKEVRSVDTLFTQGFQAVFVGTGAGATAKLRIPGESAKGVVDGVGFLWEVNLGKRKDCPGKVIVVGGGNVAVDAARCALRLGASEVTILYRRSQEEMPAYAEEVEAALEEGVKLETLQTPVKVVRQKGRVSAIVVQKMRLGEADESGRKRPIPVPGSEFEMKADWVIVAISQKVKVNLEDKKKLTLTDWGTIEVDSLTMATSRAGVFAGGDCISGAASVVGAIGAGRKAASAVDRYLGGSGELPLAKDVAARVCFAEEETYLKRPRVKMLPVDRRIGTFDEVEKGISKRVAIAEARRCLRCDLEQH